MTPMKALLYLITMTALGTVLLIVSNNTSGVKYLSHCFQNGRLVKFQKPDISYEASSTKMPVETRKTIVLKDKDINYESAGVCKDVLRKYYNAKQITFTLPRANRSLFLLHSYDKFARDFGIGTILTKAKIGPLLAQVHSNMKVIWNPDLFQTYTHGSGNMMEYFVNKEEELGYLAWICYRMKHSLNITQYTYTLSSTYSKNTPCIIASLEGKIKKDCFEDFFQKTISRNHKDDIVFLLKNAPSLDHWNSRLADDFRTNYENARQSNHRTSLPYKTDGHYTKRDLIIAMHMRRGDILDPKDPAYVPHEYNENLLNHLLPVLSCGDKTFKGIQIHLFSQGNLSDFLSIRSQLKNEMIIFHLKETKGGLIEQIDQMTHADILITSKGGFTHLVAALAPKSTIVMAIPYWQKFDGIENVLLTDPKEGSFDKEKFAYTFCKLHFYK